MPYELRGKCVYRKDTGKKVGCSKTKEKAKKYLKALYFHAKDESVQKSGLTAEVLAEFATEEELNFLLEEEEKYATDDEKEFLRENE